MNRYETDQDMMDDQAAEPEEERDPALVSLEMTEPGEVRFERGFFGIGIYHPKNSLNIGTLWRTANILGASYIFTVGARYRKQSSDTMQTPKHVPLIHYADIEDLKAHLPDSTMLIGVELDPRAQDLKTFSHPDRACYMLGAEDHGIPPTILAKCHRVIRLAGDTSMNVAVAGSIVMYHREVL